MSDNEASKNATAFVSHLGCYRYRRLPQGLCGAPATLMKAMEEKKSLSKIRQVLEVLIRMGLKVRADKLIWPKEVRYLGLKISKEGLKIDDKKCGSNCEFSKPKLRPI
uniref:Uncharacterized protein n=1 Tax=Ditylenchus dipsaci TaxID=166011 RepID=A0A915D965_9BILA